MKGFKGFHILLHTTLETVFLIGVCIATRFVIELSAKLSPCLLLSRLHWRALLYPFSGYRMKRIISQIRDVVA